MANIITTCGPVSTSSSMFEWKWIVFEHEGSFYLKTYLRWVSGSGGTKRYVRSDRCPVVNPNTGRSENCQRKANSTWLPGVTTLARMQHIWTFEYWIDGVYSTYSGRCPDNSAKLGVESTGHLHMQQWEWYQWGPAKALPRWPKDGGQHTITVTATEPNFRYPSRCPKWDGDSTKSFYVPTDRIIPGATEPVMHGNWYDYYVTWAPVSGAVSYSLQYSASDTSAWYTVVDHENVLSYNPKDYFAHAAGTQFHYRVLTHSATGDTTEGPWCPLKMVDGGMYVKTGDGNWHFGTVYVKTGDGNWHRARNVYVHNSTGWQQSIK